MQQLMGACGIAAHDVLTDEEIEDDDDDLTASSLIDVRAGNTQPALSQ